MTISKKTLYLNIILTIISIVILLGLIIYYFIFKKEKIDEDMKLGLALMAFGISGMMGILFGLWMDYTSAYTFYATVLYILSPIVFGIYLIVKD